MPAISVSRVSTNVISSRASVGTTSDYTIIRVTETVGHGSSGTSVNAFRSVRVDNTKLSSAGTALTCVLEGALATTTRTAPGKVVALPAMAAGYETVNIDRVSRKHPYY